MFVDIQLERFPSSLTIAASADGPRGGFEYIVLFKDWSLSKKMEMKRRIIQINILEFIEIFIFSFLSYIFFYYKLLSLNILKN